MSIPTSVGYDMVIKPWIEQKAKQIGEKMIDECKNCGTWYITSRDHQEEDLCVACAGLSRSWDRELHNTRQREYMRKHKRGGHRNTSNSHCCAITDQNDRVNDSLPMSGKEK